MKKVVSLLVAVLCCGVSSAAEPSKLDFMNSLDNLVEKLSNFSPEGEFLLQNKVAKGDTMEVIRAKRNALNKVKLRIKEALAAKCLCNAEEEAIDAMCDMMETVGNAYAREDEWYFSESEMDVVECKLRDVVEMWRFFDWCAGNEVYHGREVVNVGGEKEVKMKGRRCHKIVADLIHVLTTEFCFVFDVVCDTKCGNWENGWNELVVINSKVCWRWI